MVIPPLEILQRMGGNIKNEIVLELLEMLLILFKKNVRKIAGKPPIFSIFKRLKKNICCLTIEHCRAAELKGRWSFKTVSTELPITVTV